MFLARLIRFRREVVTLWHAFWSPATPLYLKVATVATVLYLVSPVDLITDVIPVIGLIDDVILIPLAVSWIVSRLPGNVRNAAASGAPRPDGKTIDGTARRL